MFSLANGALEVAKTDSRIEKNIEKNTYGRKAADN